MKNNNLYTFITYFLLMLLIIFIFSLSFKYKFKNAQRLSFRTLTNKNSNAPIKENYSNVKEGFKEGLNESDYSKKESDSIFRMIDNKLKGLSLELGGNEGKAETKKILTSTKKICDLECAKCMMAMLNDKKSIKKYSALSTSITNIINNL